MSMKVKMECNKYMSINDLNQEFIRPDYVYIPLVIYNRSDLEPLVKVGDKVLKGSVVAERKNDNFPIFSTVSGVVEDIKKMSYIDGRMINTVVIKNDFKEKMKKVNTVAKDITKLTKEEFIDRLKKNGVSGLSGNDFSTYIKYITKDEVDTLLVNGVECEPYITSDYMMMKNHAEEILETIDAIMCIMNIKKAVISFKEDFKDIKFMFDEMIGTYPNIEIIPTKNYYPAGWEQSLIKDVLNLKYEGHPSEVGVIVNNVSTIFEIYQALKFNKPLTERYVTLSGEGIKNPQNVLVKIGSRVDEVIKFIGGYTKLKNLVLVANGPLMGKSISSDELATVKALTGVVVKEVLDEEVNPCINCGKCVAACPAGLSPVLIMKNKKNVKLLKHMKPGKCMDCGLCSFVCPSKIDVRKHVKEANDEVLK